MYSLTRESIVSIETITTSNVPPSKEQISNRKLIIFRAKEYDRPCTPPGCMIYLWISLSMTVACFRTKTPDSAEVLQ